MAVLRTVTSVSLPQLLIDHIKSFSLVWNNGPSIPHAYFAKVDSLYGRVHIDAGQTILVPLYMRRRCRYG